MLSRERHRRGGLNLPAFADLPDDLCSLIMALMAPEPHRRITAADAARHPWLTCRATQQPVSSLARQVLPAAERRRFASGQVKLLLLWQLPLPC